MGYNKANSDGTTDQVSYPSYIGGILTSIGNALKTAYIKLAGYVKVDYRPTVADATNSYALQVRSVSGKTTGLHQGVDCETHLGIDGAASLRSIQGVAVVDAGITATAVTLIGAYGQARADGDVAGASFLAGLYGLIEAGAAITATHVASLWLDTHQANAVTGEYELMYLTENGAEALDQVMFLRTPAAKLFAKFDTCDAFISDGAETAGTAKKIKIDIDGTSYWINAYPGS